MNEAPPMGHMVFEVFESSRAVFEVFEADWTDFADLAPNDPGGSADRPWVSKERRTKGILTDPCQYKICLVSILSQIVW